MAPDPRNARLHDERNILSIVDSYRAHGQRKPIVVQRLADDGTAMVVRAGNGQVEAARRLGWTHVAAVVVEESDREAKAFALRDNRTADLADWDYEVISRELALAEHEGVDFTEYGWSAEELVPLRETTWFADAKGSLEDHSRTFGNTGTKQGVSVVTVRAEDEAALHEAATLMREKFADKSMTLGHIVGRLARHYLATLSHSAAEKP